LNPVYLSLKGAWFQPFEPIKRETGFKVCFQIQLVPLHHGFGVGSFHFRAQLEGLTAGDGASCCVYALDFCGQGSSWPPTDAAPSDYDGFSYSLDAWVEQVEHFLLTHAGGGPVYLAGNSLGGLVAINVAAKNPALARGLILLNATPFWGFVPASASATTTTSPPPSPAARLVNAMLPWNGALPAPGWIMGVVTPYWDRFRSLTTIRNLLKLVYVDDAKLDDQLVKNIRRPTDHPVASSTFASVLWSPKPKVSYDDALDAIRERGIPVALVYGREDPWVTPLWGQRLKRRVPRSTYYEVSNCGHCPHHEAPEVVNEIIGRWVTAVSAGAPPPEEPVVVAKGGGSSRGGGGGGGGAIEGNLVDGNPRRPTEWLVYCLDSLNANNGGGLHRRRERM
jgi:pimeloyl-ACP methyl ester carboxylesterase